MKCFKCGKKAVVLVNHKWYMCEACHIEHAVAALKRGEMLGIAVKGEPKALIIPQEGEGKWN